MTQARAAGSRPITENDTVTYQGLNHAVAWICYNNGRCLCGEFCNRVDLADGPQSVPECQLTPVRVPAVLHATHATITLTPCEGPEARWMVAVCHPGTNRIAGPLHYSTADRDTAGRLGNALTALFGAITVGQALDAMPHLRTILNLAA